MNEQDLIDFFNSKAWSNNIIYEGLQNNNPNDMTFSTQNGNFTVRWHLHNRDNGYILGSAWVEGIFGVGIDLKKELQWGVSGELLNESANLIN